MDKMREEFEKWISSFIGKSWLEKSQDYLDDYEDDNTQFMWEAWQASRATLCVELSDLEFSTDRSGDGGIMLSERVFDALKKAGVPYK